MATTNGSKTEKKEGNAFGGWGNVKMESTPFKGEISGWANEESKEKVETKALENAYKQDYDKFKEQNPGKGTASASKIFEEIEKEERDNSRHNSMRR